LALTVSKGIMKITFNWRTSWNGDGCL